MNITTKLIIPVLALLYSISVANAAHLPQDISADEVTAIAKEYEHNEDFVPNSYEKFMELYQDEVTEIVETYGYDENFVRNSYEKFMALYQGDLLGLDHLFASETDVNGLMLDVSILDCYCIIKQPVDTPLAIACNRNSIKSVEWLLDHGADANQILSEREDRDADQLLEAECINGHAYTAELLVRHGAKLTEEVIADLKKINADHLEYITELYNEEKQKGEDVEFRLENIKARERIDSLLDECREKNKK